jgi:hypothetical protein
MPKDWKNIADDEILNFEGSQTAEIARYERIMQKRSSDAMLVLTDRLMGLGDTIHKMHQGLRDKADEAFQLYERESQAQARQQRAIWWLTAVIAIFTAAYTLITAMSVYATFQANAIQQGLLDWAKQHPQP